MQQMNAWRCDESTGMGAPSGKTETGVKTGLSDWPTDRIISSVSRYPGHEQGADRFQAIRELSVLFDSERREY